MEEILIPNDVTVFYKTAKSFPDGVLDAHTELHKLITFSPERRYFGISRPENGVIVYRAAAEEIHNGEGREFNCDTLVLKKGRYISITIADFMKDIKSIERTFKQLLAHPGLDPNGYCMELYLNDKDVQCMVRLK